MILNNVSFPYEHCLDFFICDKHPITHWEYYVGIFKEHNEWQHLGVYRKQPGSTVFQEVKVYFGGGATGRKNAYADSQISGGNAKLRDIDGALIVSFTCSPLGSADDKRVACTEVVSNVDKPWTLNAIPLPVSVPAVVVDQVARDMAQRASDNANTQRSDSIKAYSSFNSSLESLRKISVNLSSRIDRLPTMEQVLAAAWQKAIDYTGTPEFAKTVNQLSLNMFVDAINFARTAPATKSRLRSLIELIVKEIMK